jgi:hypothetical protein
VTAGNSVPGAKDPGELALQYYASRYNDRDVSVQVTPAGDHSYEADIRKKNGLLVKRLYIKGDNISERRSGLRGWVLDQFMFTN